MDTRGYDMALAEQEDRKAMLRSENGRIAEQRDQARAVALALQVALQAIYDECSELSDINNIGSHENHVMRQARSALRKAIAAGARMWPAA